MKILGVLAIWMPIVLWTNMTSAAGPDLQPIGSLTLNFLSSGKTDSQRWSHLSGSIDLDSGQGTVQSCIDDGYFQANGNINFDIRCSVLMDDESSILLNYAGVFVPGSDFWELMGEGEVIRQGNGVEYWISELKMLTASENYSWINNHIFIGRGKELSAPSADSSGLVVYELYKVAY